MTYKVLKKFNDSGQKKVFLVDDKKYGISILKMGSCPSLSSLSRIEREIEILKSLDSHYFPKIYSFKARSDGSFVLYEEYIESESLRDKMTLLSDEKKAFELILKIIKAMEIVWDRKIIHRDLKPENILIRNDTLEPVIIDFGIARIAEDGKSLTNTLHAQGPHTPGYTSPEQLKNEKEAISYKSDFYCLGIVLAELILGINPFSPSLVGKGLCCNDNILDNSYCLHTSDIVISERAQKIIKKMLMYYPYERYRKASLLKNDIEEFLYGKN